MKGSSIIESANRRIIELLGYRKGQERVKSEKIKIKRRTKRGNSHNPISTSAHFPTLSNQRITELLN